MKKVTRNKGVSLVLSLAKYNGFSATINEDKSAVRIILGWFSMSLYFYDMESTIEHLVDSISTYAVES